MIAYKGKDKADFKDKEYSKKCYIIKNEVEVLLSFSLKILNNLAIGFNVDVSVIKWLGSYLG